MSVRVVARIRPLLEKELDKDVIVHAVSNNNSSSENDKAPFNVVKIPNPKNEAEEFSFAFNGVYDNSTTQEALFSAEGTYAYRLSHLRQWQLYWQHPMIIATPVTSYRRGRKYISNARGVVVGDRK